MIFADRLIFTCKSPVHSNLNAIALVYLNIQSFRKRLHICIPTRDDKAPEMSNGRNSLSQRKSIAEDAPVILQLWKKCKSLYSATLTSETLGRCCRNAGPAFVYKAVMAKYYSLLYMCGLGVQEEVSLRDAALDTVPPVKKGPQR